MQRDSRVAGGITISLPLGEFDAKRVSTDPFVMVSPFGSLGLEPAGIVKYCTTTLAIVVQAIRLPGLFIELRRELGTLASGTHLGYREHDLVLVLCLGFMDLVEHPSPHVRPNDADHGEDEHCTTAL